MHGYGSFKIRQEIYLHSTRKHWKYSNVVLQPTLFNAYGHICINRIFGEWQLGLLVLYRYFNTVNKIMNFYPQNEDDDMLVLAFNYSCLAIIRAWSLNQFLSNWMFV
jgi:hypothetical protein